MALDREDWKRLDTLLEGALDKPPAERRAWLDEVCAGDPEARATLEELLAHAESESGPLGRGVQEWATQPKVETPAESIQPGQSLGRFQILGLLGSGGMGRVFRALDPALGREVAIKALADAFRDDAASLRRFECEARLLATLNHPGIATIYGFEVLEGAPYLILELVEGETVTARLLRGSIPVEETVSLAVQIAEALEEAHRKGVVHRDLKPSNVMLTAAGRVKVLDFGLAKSVATREGGPIDQAHTVTGVILGTAPYMSPEQVRGEPVDVRSDVWAFGCLLYEMLAGRRAFAGNSVPEILAVVLRDEPDWSRLPDETPDLVRRLLQRCLRKDPHDRLQDIGDARLELAELQAPGRATLRWRARHVLRARAGWWLALSVGAGAAILAGSTLTRPHATPQHTLRLSVDLPQPLTLTKDFAAPFALSPDGRSLVLVASDGSTSRLYVRSLDDLSFRVLAGTEGARQPSFAPDGRAVAFFADRKLKRISLQGGSVESLAEIGGNPRGVSWGSKGWIVLAPSQTSGLVRVRESGGAPEAVTRLDESRGEASHRWPEVLPGGAWVVFTVAGQDESFDDARIELVSLETGERRLVLKGGTHSHYLPSGHLLYARRGQLYATRFDLERREASGTPEVVIEGIRYDARNGGANLAVAATGALLFLPGVPSSPESTLGWIDAAGTIKRLVDQPRVFRSPRLSPDGSRIAVVIGPDAESDLWTVDADATLTRASFGLSPQRPVWRPDGKGITVGAKKDGRWQLLDVALDGSGQTKLLYESAQRLYPCAWLPDGRRLIFQEHTAATGWDLWALELDVSGQASSTPRPIAVTPFQEANAAISPDGRWLAYESDELDGIVEVYVRSFPEGTGKVRLSVGGARWPRWSRSGGAVFWESTPSNTLTRTPGRVEAGKFRAAPAEVVWNPSVRENPRLMFTPNYPTYDVDAAGRFLVLERNAPIAEPALTRPVVVLDWLEQLRARLPGAP
jgi:serine/threonine-protein kinase